MAAPAEKTLEEVGRLAGAGTEIMRYLEARRVRSVGTLALLGF